MEYMMNLVGSHGIAC